MAFCFSIAMPLSTKESLISRVYQLENKVKDGRSHVKECLSLTKKVLEQLSDTDADILLFEENGKKYHVSNLGFTCDGKTIDTQEFIKWHNEKYGAQEYIQMIKLYLIWPLPEEKPKDEPPPFHISPRDLEKNSSGFGKELQKSVEKTKTKRQYF